MSVKFAAHRRVWGAHPDALAFAVRHAPLMGGRRTVLGLSPQYRSVKHSNCFFELDAGDAGIEPAPVPAHLTYDNVLYVALNLTRSLDATEIARPPHVIAAA